MSFDSLSLLNRNILSKIWLVSFLILGTFFVPIIVHAEADAEKEPFYVSECSYPFYQWLVYSGFDATVYKERVLDDGEVVQTKFGKEGIEIYKSLINVDPSHQSIDGYRGEITDSRPSEYSISIRHYVDTVASIPTIKGKFTHPFHVWLISGKTYVMSFYGKEGYRSYFRNAYFTNGSDKIQFDSGGKGDTPGWTRFLFRFTYTGPSGYHDFVIDKSVEFEIAPIFFGNLELANNEIYDKMGLQTQLQSDVSALRNLATLIEQDLRIGDSSVSSAATAAKGDFDLTSGKVDKIESEFSSDFNTNMHKIDTSKGNLSSLQKFKSSAKWVSDVYQKLVVNTPFETLVYFSLVMGISLVLIGRLRGGK